MPANRRRFDQRGTIAVTAALAASCLIGVAALAIDIGAILRAKRAAQGAVDLAAMLAAADPGQAGKLALRSLGDNGYPETGGIVVTSGRYVADSSRSVPQRFQVGGAPANAVRVSLTTSVRTSFAKVVGLPAEIAISADGTAATAQMAAFSIGSGLASLDGGVANAILGGLLGTKLTLRALDYQALLSTSIDSYSFLNALSTNLRLATFEQTLQATATLDQVLSAVKAAMPAGGMSSLAASSIDVIARSGSNGSRLRVADLIDLGDAAALAPGPGTRGPSVPAMDLISAAASLANGRNQLSIDLGATLPGLLNTRVTLAIGEKRQHSGWVEPRTPNATVRTAQVRLLLETELKAPLGLGSIKLPIYAEAAQAKGTLVSVACPWSRADQRRVEVEAQPGVLSVSIADLPRSAIIADGPPPDLNQSAKLVTLPLISITGRASATVNSFYPTKVVFSNADISNNVIKRVTSTGLSQSLTSSLLNNLSLDIDGLPVGASVRPVLLTALNGVTPILDTTIDSILRTLGVQIGTVDIGIDGTRCDHAVLVQ